MQNIFRNSRPASQPHVPLTIAYVDGSGLASALDNDRVVAAIRFGADTRVDTRDPRLLTVGLPEPGSRNTVEIWQSPHPLIRGAEQAMSWAGNEDILFVQCLVDETHYPHLQATTEESYRRILALVRHQGYPHVLRVWNYFPGINDRENGLERYQAFCLGRYRALENSMHLEATLPAASAIGTVTPGFLVYLVAARHPGIQIENPRQISAFHYPPQYSPRSPSFSRAVLKHWNDDTSHLYISGTASIVGHRTRHIGNAADQLQETLRNLDALIDTAGRKLGAAVDIALLKVYIRAGLPLEPVQTRLRQHFGPDTRTLFLQGDICRNDLLLEIEGHGVGYRGIAPLPS